jgi:imidazolonepropionase-like amidohydrolase
MKPIVSICAFLVLSIHALSQKTVLLAKNLIDGTGKVIANPAVIISDNKIIAIENKENLHLNKYGNGFVIIDLGEYTLLPGMIDAHVHPDNSSDDYQVGHLRASSAAKTLTGLKAVQDLLSEGWTALRVAGDEDVGYANLEIRNAINNGLFVGPHIYGAGHYLSVTGGGGDINFISYEQKIIPDGLIVDGPEEIRKAVRTEIKNGSDWIKILETGAFMTTGDNPQNVHFSPEELKMAVEEAGRRDVPVMAHAHATEGIKQAVKAGVRSIEHGSYMDEEAIDLMVQHGTYLIPTLTIDLYFKEKLADSKALAKAIALAKDSREGMYEKLRLGVKKGLKIGVGTDYIGWPANYSAREFGELIKIGMSPMQAIQAGTIVNAQLLNKDKEIGSIEIGKFADIIAVKGDPLKDISELQRVKFVMMGGKVVKNEKIKNQ